MLVLIPVLIKGIIPNRCAMNSSGRGLVFCRNETWSIPRSRGGAYVSGRDTYRAVFESRNSQTVGTSAIIALRRLFAKLVRTNNMLAFRPGTDFQEDGSFLPTPSRLRITGTRSCPVPATARRCCLLPLDSWPWRNGQHPIFKIFSSTSSKRLGCIRGQGGRLRTSHLYLSSMIFCTVDSLESKRGSRGSRRVYDQRRVMPRDIKGHDQPA